MRLTEFKLLIDENVNSVLTEALKQHGCDVVHVYDVGLEQTADTDILTWANENKRIVVTLDDDFGKLVFKEKQSFFGIIRLRPGHLVGSLHVPTIETILNAAIDFKPPFLLVAERKANNIQLRYRTFAE